MILFGGRSASGPNATVDVDGIVDSVFVFGGWEGFELRREEPSRTSPNQDDSDDWHSIVWSEKESRKNY
jgi:hypothetical protein